MLLAAAPAETQLRTRTIAECVETPYNHVSKAVLKLRDLSIVDVYRGRSGGVQLNHWGRAASIGWLLRELDTRTDVAECESSHGPCPLNRQCGLRSALNGAREAFYASLDATIIAELPHEQQMLPLFETIGLRPGL